MVWLLGKKIQTNQDLPSKTGGSQSCTDEQQDTDSEQGLVAAPGERRDLGRILLVFLRCLVCGLAGRQLLRRLRPVLHPTSSRDVGSTAWAYARANLMDVDFLPVAQCNLCLDETLV